MPERLAFLLQTLRHQVRQEDSLQEDDDLLSFALAQFLIAKSRPVADAAHL